MLSVVRTLTLLALVAAQLRAETPDPPSAMIVTHASCTFDKNRSSEEAVVSAVSTSKQAGLVVHYLIMPWSEFSLTMDYAAYMFGRELPEQIAASIQYDWLERLPNSSYFVGSQLPDSLEPSFGGEHRFLPPSATVVLAGGFLEGCLKNTLSHQLLRYIGNQTKNLHFILVTDAIYVGRSGRLGIDQLENETLEQSLKRFRVRSNKDWVGFIGKHMNLSDPLEWASSKGNKEENMQVPPFSNGSLEFVVMRNGSEAGRIGEGSYRATLDFVTSHELPERLRGLSCERLLKNRN